MNVNDDHLTKLGELTDQNLLAELRAGNVRAYAALWSRYIGLAIHVAQRYAPGRAEDLASEAFLAVFQQVAEKGAGPREAFWPYLNSVMRNLATKWGRAGQLVELDPDVDTIDAADPLEALSSQASSAELLTAFEALPERWQRVLWLAEVEQVPRSTIAKALRIRPNAVSALMRRAKRGLRLEWLTALIPKWIHGDPDHHADKLPAYIAEKQKMAINDRIALEAHLPQCRTCTSLQQDLRTQFRSSRRTTLGATGFAALAVALPAIAPGGVATGGAAAAAAITGAGLSAAGIGTIAVATLAAGTLAVVGVFTVAPTALTPRESDASGPAVPTSGSSHDSDARSAQSPPKHGTGKPPLADTDARLTTSSHNGSAARSEPAEASEAPVDQAVHFPDENALRLPGRENSNAAIPVIDWTGPTENFLKPKPPAPQPIPPTLVRPPAPEPKPTGPDPGGEYEPGPEPGGSTDSLLSAGFNPVTAPSRAFFAPVLGGHGSPGAEIHVNLFDPADPHAADGREYLAEVDGTGDWQLDLRGLGLSSGTYEFTVWALRSDEHSTPVQGFFEILPPTVYGIDHPEVLPLAEASTTGIVLEFVGPPGGTACVVIANGSAQFAEVHLDDGGRSLRRLKLFQSGSHFLAVSFCSDGYAGPTETWVVPVGEKGDAAPWGPGRSGGKLFALVEP